MSLYELVLISFSVLTCIEQLISDTSELKKYFAIFGFNSFLKLDYSIISTNLSINILLITVKHFKLALDGTLQMFQQWILQTNE